MHGDNRPLSEQFRVIAKDWCDLDSAARLMEETKTAVLSQRMKALGDKPAAHAERDVKASDEWHEFIRRMVEARTAANLKKLQLEYLRMQFSERQSFEATARAERRL
jgi:hypothetical protein